MQPLHLAFTEIDCARCLRESVPKILAGEATLAEMREAQRMFRRMAVAKLLSTGTPGEFFQDLSRSARAFLHFLDAGDGSAAAASHFEPFFDAVACGDDDSAERLSSHAPGTFDRDSEYEEDFLFFRLAMDLVIEPAERGGRDETELLTRFEELSSEVEDPRFEVCAGLVERDSDRFREGVEAWSEARYESYLERAPFGEIDPDDALTTEKVSVQGLAIVRIAERRGIAAPPELRGIPSLARRLDRFPLVPPAPWEEMPSYGPL